MYICNECIALCNEILAEDEEREVAEALVRRLEGLEIAIARRVGEHDALYGSVTSADIAEQLAAQGFNIEKRLIDIHDPIKALGVYRVPVKLHADVKPEIRVWVIKQ